MVSALTLLILTGSPEVALLSSSGTTGELRFQPIDGALAVPVTRFAHAEGSPVLGTLLPGTRVVLASAVMKAEGDVSFGSALIRLEAGRAPRLLADQLAYGSRPLVTAEGRVFVSRGRPGPSRSEARIDELTVEELDPRTAKPRTIHSTRGFVTFLVGALGREIVIYEVTPGASRLIAVHADTLGVRVLADLKQLPAHDLSVDAPRKRVLFTQLTADRAAYEAKSLSLVDFSVRVIASSPEITLLPFARADGRVLISKGAGLGTMSADGGEGLAAQGPGFERLVAERNGLLVDVHERPGDFPSLIIFEGGQSRVISTPSDARLDVAGVLP